MVTGIHDNQNLSTGCILLYVNYISVKIFLKIRNWVKDSIVL